MAAAVERPMPGSCASVAALRETSILVVMLLSMRVLKETVTLPRLGGAVLIVIGAVLIRLA